MPKDFILTFNVALEHGLQNMDKAIALEGDNYPNCENPEDYLNHKISYLLDAEKQKALSEIKTTVVDIALKASERVIKRNLNNEDNKKLVEQTVDEFKQAN